MACDGDIAQEEIDTLKNFAIHMPIFDGLNIEESINSYISSINQNGVSFLHRYLKELSEEILTQDDELQIVDLAIKMIEADNRIEYSEIKFFKKIRVRLSLSDEQILAHYPNKEDFLLPDINEIEDLVWDDNVMFTNIHLNK